MKLKCPDCGDVDIITIKHTSTTSNKTVLQLYCVSCANESKLIPNKEDLIEVLLWNWSE